MSDTIHEPKQLNQKQIGTGVVADTWAQGDTATVTIDGIDFTVTIGTLVTTAQVATTIQQAFEGTPLTDTAASCIPTIAQGGAKAIPQFRDMTATVASSTVSFTAAVTGATGAHTQPFTISGTEATAGTGTFTVTSAATAHKGKHSADDADNWSAGAVLADNDNVFFISGNVDLLDGLAVTCQPATITKYKSYSGRVGRSYINKINSQPLYHYPDYRTLYFTTDDNTVVTTANLEVGEGPGSSRFMWDAGAGQALLNIFGQGTREDQGIPCILFKGSHASNEVNNIDGDLGIAFFGGETAVVAALQTGNGPTSTAKTICRSGVTLATVVVNGGDLWTDSAITTCNQANGRWYHGAGTVTTANIDGGVAYPQKNATWTTVRIGSSGEFNTTKGTDPFSITNAVVMRKGAIFRDPQGRCGNVSITLQGCDIDDVTIVGGPGKVYTITRSQS